LTARAFETFIPALCDIRAVARIAQIHLEDRSGLRVVLDHQHPADRLHEAIISGGYEQRVKRDGEPVSEYASRSVDSWPPRPAKRGEGQGVRGHPIAKAPTPSIYFAHANL